MFPAQPRPRTLIRRRPRIASPPALRAAAAAVLLALSVSACGGSHSGASTSTSSPTTSAGTTTSTRSTSSRTSTTPKKTTAKPKQAAGTRTSATHTTSTPHAGRTPTTPKRTTTTPTSTTPAYTRPIHATLVGENHHPIVNKQWTYTVTVTDANGRPMPGTAYTEFTFAGQVVGHETPPTHPLKGGRLVDTVEFPPASVGQPIALQVVVHTNLGSVTLSWPVKVKK